ncbi:MAG: SIS domain-containing protein [Nocardioidaceae bacterium]
MTETVPVTPTGGQRYLATTAGLVEQLSSEAWPAIVAAADLVAECLRAGGTVHAFGTGHSHMLAEELFYRAGGLVDVRPLLFDGLMLHTGAARSTDLERLSGLAVVLLEHHGVAAGDVLVVASNSGGNAVSTEIAAAARDRGLSVIAVTSLRHATSSLARQTDGHKLHEIAHVVVDNGGCPGDACVTIDGAPHAVGPTSTVVGAAIVNAIAVEAVDRLCALGHVPQVYASSNLAGGDDVNHAAGVRR